MFEAGIQAQKAKALLLGGLKNPQGLSALSLQEWDLLVRVARRARLLGRLEADLNRLELLDALPAKVREHLQAARNVIEHRRTLVRWEVNRLLWASAALKIPVILLKGSAYVLADLPPAPGRLFADVDLLIPERSISEFEAKLIEKGWMRLPIDPYDDRYYRVWMHEIPPLRHSERGTEIDIHHRILPRTSRFRSDPEALLDRAVSLNSDWLKVLASEDMVLHAMLHLLVEADPAEGMRLRDLLDTHDLLCKFGEEPEFWQRLTDRAMQLGWQRLLYYGLRYTKAVFATPIPDAALEAAKRGAPLPPLGWLMDQLVALALWPNHPDHSYPLAGLARWLLYIRSHWLRMPSFLLFRHLYYKATLRFRGVTRTIDLAQLDLRQQ